MFINVYQDPTQLYIIIIIIFVLNDAQFKVIFISVIGTDDTCEDLA